MSGTGAVEWLQDRHSEVMEWLQSPESDFRHTAQSRIDAAEHPSDTARHWGFVVPQALSMLVGMGAFMSAEQFEEVVTCGGFSPEQSDVLRRGLRHFNLIAVEN